jgi:hypothetical protein
VITNDACVRKVCAASYWARLYASLDADVLLTKLIGLVVLTTLFQLQRLFSVD